MLKQNPLKCWEEKITFFFSKPEVYLMKYLTKRPTYFFLCAEG